MINLILNIVDYNELDKKLKSNNCIPLSTSRTKKINRNNYQEDLQEMLKNSSKMCI